MPKGKEKTPADYIVPLNMNGLQGRMLSMPAPKNKHRELLFIYGHHSNLERWWGVMQDLNQYGAVTMPDLPGFGGMQSFYRIGRVPTIDAMADYLAAFVKLKYKNRKVTILGLSFGFVVVTRMLQRYPDLAKKVDLLISVVGFSRYDDFKFTKSRYRFYLHGARLFSHRLSSIFFKNVILNPGVLRVAYAKTHNAQTKFAGLSGADRRAIMDFEVHLWHCNDVRTHMKTTEEFLTVDNCNNQIDIPLWHISADKDNYFHHHRVEQHLKVIFPEVHVVIAKLANHAPSIIADKKAAAPLIPRKLRQVLAKA